MSIKVHHLETKKTARYATYGNAGPKTKYFWFVLHGSKMTCEQMLYKFSDFDPEEHFVVAPEGLNRFYANGFGGDVVASWMTSRDRLKEIDDLSVYLSELYRRNIDLLPKNATKIILGFSQGGTTMFRWLHGRTTSADLIISYSCWIPEDIDLRNSKTQLTIRTIVYTYGTDDQFLTAETHTKIKQIAARNELKLQLEPYVGDHRVDRKQLAILFAKYIHPSSNHIQ